VSRQPSPEGRGLTLIFDPATSDTCREVTHHHPPLLVETGYARHKTMETGSFGPEEVAMR